MPNPSFTYVWWGDGYFVYEGERYIGNDDQVDLIHEMAHLGLVAKLNVDEEVPLLMARETLTEMKEALAAGGDPE